MSYNLVNSTTGTLTRVAGRGKAEYGASTIRSGSISISTPAASTSVERSVTFTTPMPDTDYEINFQAPSNNTSNTFVASVINKTTNGFTVLFRVGTGASDVISATWSYTAFKLYSDVEINDLVNYGTRFPDYAHEITGISNPWTATQDVYIVVNIVSNNTNFILNIDGENVLARDSSDGIGVSHFAGYVREGQVIQWNGSLGSTVRIWPLK